MFKPAKFFLLFYVFSCIAIVSFAQGSKDLVRLNNGDTIHGEIYDWQVGGLIAKAKVEMTDTSGQYQSFLASDVDYFINEGRKYASLPMRPWKNDNNKQFMLLLMKNEPFVIYKFENILETEFGPMYDFKYYLYRDNKFIKEITNSNYKKLLGEHFCNCRYMDSILSLKKNHFRDDRLSSVAKGYNLNCK